MCGESLKCGSINFFGGNFGRRMWYGVAWVGEQEQFGELCCYKSLFCEKCTSCEIYVKNPRKGL